ncbi:potassium voltage-gated channel protein Shab [Eurytemora carolleeae]|uniref:potassium voltage-gated channel protein Shab n=1 Tax=Eurytemora carolleeae TaxID=1294199 RepID=UPI000C758D1B|nr:potassium voltage-gated channel protein Shab [Eurytemora carolleeae]|eukprot:XP_023328907.1 potassium voltage-gated channel protein Shab-like [Eurytemora affinis]
MTVPVGSEKFLSLPRRQQNELIFNLLAPLARLRHTFKNARQDLQYGCTDKPSLPIIPPQRSFTEQAEKSRYGSVSSNSTNEDEEDGEEEEEEKERLEILRMRKIHKKVVLNVGGVKHEVMWRMLERQPRSRLGLLALSTSSVQILELCDAYSLEDNEYYFDRHPRSFNCILNFYRIGKLYVLEELCVMDFSQDLDYWMIDDIYLEPCCEGKYTGTKEHVVEEVKKNSKVNTTVVDQEYFGEGPCARYQKCLWDLMEKPNSSIFAKILSLFSISLVLISTVGMCLNTMPEFKHEVDDQVVDNAYFALIEAVCIAWFTLEYFLRLAGAPNKWHFLKGPMNVIDVLAILPYYLSLIFVEEDNLGLVLVLPGNSTTTTTPEPESNETEFEDMSRVIQVFRIARIMRIFKLARSSTGLQAIAHTMKSSYKELSLLLLFVGMGMLIFGSLAYFVEKDFPGSKYTSIPESMWWAIQTMTSVGYGDLSPITPLGKLVGSCCGVSGVLVMALPIPIVVENFGAYYMEQKKREVIAKKKFDNAEARIEDEASREVERENLIGVLQNKPGPFSVIPQSPRTGSVHSAEELLNCQKNHGSKD